MAMKKKKGARRSPAFVSACFNPAVKDPQAAVKSGDVSAAGVNGIDGIGTPRIPTHLVITVNGIIGSAANWRFAAKQFVNRYPEDLIVHCSESNYSSLTFDGVDVMGERLAKEVLSVVARRPELQKISFVGHSLGGLVARYAIGRLYTKSDQKHASEVHDDFKTRNCEIQCLEEKIKGKIAGLEPVSFITFATPHLGSRFHKQVQVNL